jgi:hypothetical protein
MIGLITLDVKQAGKRSAGKPHAAFDVAGAGNVTMAAGLRPIAKAMEVPPAPTVRAPAPDPTERGCDGTGSASLIPRHHLPMPRVRSLGWRRSRGFRTLGAIVLLCAVAFASKEFVKPAAHHARTYPAHDEHANERVTVAADPYDLADKAEIFSVHWNEEGYLPIFLIISNDSDQPISLTNMKAEFVTVRRDKIQPATSDDLYRRLAHVSASGPTYPIPFPRTKVKGAVSKQARQEIDAAQFDAKAVEAHSTQSGFLFFDVSGIRTPLPGAHLYVTGVQDGKGNELMYFEVPFEKYLGAPGTAP